MAVVTLGLVACGKNNNNSDATSENKKEETNQTNESLGEDIGETSSSTQMDSPSEIDGEKFVAEVNFIKLYFK